MAFFRRPRQTVPRAERLFRASLARLGPGDLAIDCGANVGAVALPLARTGADLIAFEPDGKIFKILGKRLVGFNNVTLHQAAVACEAGTAQLLRSPYFDEDLKAESLKSTILPDALTRDRNGGWRRMDETNALEVECIDLLALLRHEIGKRGRIALLKIDIEGAELEILEAMAAENLFDSIGFTVAEMHAARFPGTEARITALRATIGARHPDTRVNLDWG